MRNETVPDDTCACDDTRTRAAAIAARRRPARLRQLQQQWEWRFAAYEADYPDLAAEFRRRIAGELPADFARRAEAWIGAVAQRQDNVATRKASQLAIEALAPMLPELLGGSADLTGSNLTDWKGCQAVRAGQGGNYLHYGVRSSA